MTLVDLEQAAVLTQRNFPEVSLFINGREFPLGNVAGQDNVPLEGALRSARHDLVEEVKHPEELASLLDLTPEQLIEESQEQIDALTRLIEQLPHHP